MPPATPYDATGIEHYTLPEFEFTNGTKKPIKVAFRQFNPTSAKKVLIPTCFAGRINSTLNFTTGTLSDCHVIVVAMLGNGESSSPSNDPNFPNNQLRYQDCINVQYSLMTEHLGIQSLDAVIGFSMGGQQAYYWAAMHGSGREPFVKNAVVICGAAKTSGHNYAFLEGPIAALETSYDYAQGTYRKTNTKPTQGLRAFGRAYAAWLTSPAWFRQELYLTTGSSSLHDWLHPTVASHESWDPEDLLTLARMWQAGDVGSTHSSGDYRKALMGVTCRVLVMPSATDQYFPPEDSENEVKFLKRGIFAPIPTIWGHIGGGGANEVDSQWMDARITKFLAGKGPSPREPVDLMGCE